jgi:Ca2+-transporting ATPase
MPSPRAVAYWAGLSCEQALIDLGTSRAGLSLSEAAARRLRDGPNTLPRPRRRSWYLELGANFIHLFAILLWAGAGLAGLIGMPELAYAIVAVIVINGLFSFCQEYQAERAAEALMALLPAQVSVRREGQELIIPATEVVAGDVLVLAEGQAIAADARLIASERLRVDMSSLTGESRPTPRTAAPVHETDRPTPTLPNLVFAGTAVASGRGEAVVYATGTNTQLSHIARLTQAERERPSPLQRELRRVTRLVTVLALGLGGLFFLAGTQLGGLSTAAAFTFGIGIIVANVPEGLLPTLTLALALGVRRMAGRNAIVKRLSAVETLGATTVILTDKTGTLTENEMTLRELWTGGRAARVTGVGYAPDGTVEPLDLSAPPSKEAIDLLLRTSALCCDARLLPPQAPHQRWRAVGDPTEAAILVAAAKGGYSQEHLSSWPRIAELPFDSLRKRMTTIQHIDGQSIACVKGAPSELIPLCTAIRWGDGGVSLTEELRDAVQAAHDALARRGLRVLAVASRVLAMEPAGADGWEPAAVERGLTFLGLLALEDPPRPEVPAALAACHAAGLRVIMTTGDDRLTAVAIGSEIGLYDEHPRVLTGTEIDGLSAGDLDAVLGDDNVLFARVSPEHKLRLVEAFQRRGETVAVTGDGVNDAPALKRADIGVAMGATGTDVAREAADMVLADDNFASIVAAISEGRSVYDNIRKFVTYIFASNVPEIVPFVAFVLFGIPLPLTVMQILAVDLGTDLLPALALGSEPPEPDVMLRRPRRRDARLLDAPTLLRAYLWLGAIEAALSLGAFFYAQALAGWRPGLSLAGSGVAYATATTMALAGIVACQAGNVFACRSQRQSIGELGWGTNRPLLGAIAIELALLLVLIYFAPLAGIFGLAPLGPFHWLALAAFPLALIGLEEGRKALARRRYAHA